MKPKHLLIVFCLLPFALCAQDAHYWTEQFGNKSMLLGGNVIGSVDDLGAVFYNPARLAWQEDPTFLISAKAYQLSSLRVKDGVERADLDQSVFGNAPTLASGSFTVKFLPKHKFAYAFLSRQQMQFNLGMSTQKVYEYTGSWAGEETLDIEFSTSRNIQDEWMGGSWAYALNEHFSVGLSGFASVYNQKRTYSLEETGNSADGLDVASFTRIRNKSLAATSLVFKLGANYKRKGLGIGLTVTTPYVNVMTSGKAYFNESLAGFDLNEDGNIQDDNRWIKNNTSSVDAQYKTPWAVGLGAAYDFGWLTVHGSAEWYGAVEHYYALKPEPFVAQKSPQDPLTVRDRVYEERASVLNWGLGVEFGVLDKVDGYMSFSTDYSTLDEYVNTTDGLVTDNFSMSVFTADLFHYAGGFILNFDKLDITMGTVYSRGDQSIGKLVNLPGDTRNPDERVDVIWERWRFLVGFSLPFYKFGY